jgi:hypothetical protein
MPLEVHDLITCYLIIIILKVKGVCAGRIANLAMATAHAMQI